MSEFGVDLRGIIDLLSRHIYSGPEVYLRELLQNSRDAIVARAQGTDANPLWGIRLRPATDSQPFRIVDDGVGLTAAEITEFLAIVGRSSKRDVLGLHDHDFLGHFGIGLLSCFMVAQGIEITTRKAGSLGAVWHGQADGTYTVTELSERETDALPIGTTVSLHPTADMLKWVSQPEVQRLATHYAQFLTVPVEVHNPDGSRTLVTGPAPFLDPVGADAVVEFGTSVLGQRPMDVIEIDVPGSATKGVAYVLSKPRAGRMHQGGRVYLSRMLLTDDAREVMPDWAFFVRPVISSDLLTPTASREALVHDDILEATRDAIGVAVKGWVRRIAREDPLLLQEFLGIHNHAVREACVEDREFFQILGRHLSFETPTGWHSLERLAASGEDIQYAMSLDEYRMLVGMRAPGVLVNASYTFHEDLLRRVPEVFADVTVQEADVLGMLSRLQEPPLADQRRVQSLADRATAALADLEVDVQVKMLADATVPALYVADAQVLSRADMARVRDQSSGNWAGILSAASEALDDARAAAGDAVTRAQICLNWAHPVVQHVAALQDQTVLARATRLLYVQALLEGHRPMSQRDRAVLTESLDDLITLSIGLTTEGLNL